jgi:predicted nucleic acid-binding Zn ribbon protein
MTSDDPVRSGADLAREALARAKAGRPTSAAPRRRVAGERRRTDQWSGARADDRDPQAVSTTIRDLVDGRGWQHTSQVATVLSCWDDIVGDTVASHCRPESLNGGELVLAAESTSWATQLRLLAPTLMTRIADQLGAGLVTAIRVHGPTGPGWGHGPRRVAGRGPRDTYG